MRGGGWGGVSDLMRVGLGISVNLKSPPAVSTTSAVCVEDMRVMRVMRVIRVMRVMRTMTSGEGGQGGPGWERCWGQESERSRTSEE